MRKVTVVALIIVTLVTMSCNKNSKTEVGDQITIVDILNREVLIPKNASRIIIGDHYWEVFLVGGDNAFDNVVGWSATTWVKWRNSIYQEFVKSVPRLEELEDVGLTFNQTFDIEKFLSLNPDLFILPVYQFEALDDGLKEAIAGAGVPIVLIDFSTGTKELHNKSINILGQIYNNEAIARELNNLYNDYHRQINEIISNKGNLYTAYLEKASKGPGIYDETWGESNWAPILDRAGADNISKKIIKGVGYADNEFILSENPDYIFFTGSTWPSKEDAVQLGFSVEKTETKRTALRYVTEREGWLELKAVQNKNIFIMHHGFIRSFLDFIPTIYIAQNLYPDDFSDLDADRIAIDFFEKYLPVDFHGSWLCSLYDE